MNDGNIRIVAQIIGLVLALFLVARGLRFGRLGSRRTAGLAITWVGIIMALTLVVSALTRR